ncbi:MAG TPA: hypothetical protein VFY98_07135, partial [Intrasporangium sp.]|nr:hypothetical protein [Intrasporangium sp.]
LLRWLLHPRLWSPGVWFVQVSEYRKLDLITWSGPQERTGGSQKAVAGATSTSPPRRHAAPRLETDAGLDDEDLGDEVLTRDQFGWSRCGARCGRVVEHGVVERDETRVHRKSTAVDVNDFETEWTS